MTGSGATCGAMPASMGAAWLGVLLLAGCGGAAPPYAVGTLERDRLELTADSDQPIVAIPVSEGDRVAAGELLLRQDDTLARARLAQARAARDAAAAALEEAEAGPRVQEIAQAEARLAAAESAVVTARLELDRERALEGRGFVAENRLDLLQGRYDEAVARRREAAAALEVLREGTRPEALRRAREGLAAAEARVDELAVAVERTALRAPVAATVEALPRELGERPPPGGVVAVLRAAGPAYARVYVPEPLRAGLDVGAAAEITVDGRPAPLPGRLRWISSEAAFTPYFALTQRDRSRLAYLAEVELTGEAAGGIPVGLPVEVRFGGHAP